MIYIYIYILYISEIRRGHKMLEPYDIGRLMSDHDGLAEIRRKHKAKLALKSRPS